MYTLKKQLATFDINRQREANKEKIAALSLILSGKSRSDIMDDYEIFKELNLIIFETTRRYSVYEPISLVEHAKGKLAKITENLRIQSIESYCDVGCGWGHFPRAAFEMGSSQNCGIDIAKNPQWERYLEGTNDKLRYLAEDITGRNTFDTYWLTTSFAAFEHFSDPDGMLAAMAKLVANQGYLYICFNPIYNSTNGYHMYRHIHIPWYHLIFSEDVCNKYYEDNGLVKKSKINSFNKWSALDFMVLFSNFKDLTLLKMKPLWDFRHYWFANAFPDLLPQYSLEELMVDGFEVVYKRI